MKQTLEELLAKAKPEVRKNGLNELLAIYMGPESGTSKELIKLLATLPAEVRAYGARWSTLSTLIGTIYRLEIDGYDTFKLLGITGDEQDTVLEGMNLLRNKISNYQTSPEGETKQLYDQVRAVGF